MKLYFVEKIFPTLFRYYIFFCKELITFQYGYDGKYSFIFNKVEEMEKIIMQSVNEKNYGVAKNMCDKLIIPGEKFEIQKLYIIICSTNLETLKFFYKYYGININDPETYNVLDLTNINRYNNLYKYVYDYDFQNIIEFTLAHACKNRKLDIVNYILENGYIKTKKIYRFIKFFFVDECDNSEYEKILSLLINYFRDIDLYIDINLLFNYVCLYGSFHNSYLLKCAYPDECYYNNYSNDIRYKVKNEKTKKWIIDGYPKMVSTKSSRKTFSDKMN